MSFSKKTKSNKNVTTIILIVAVIALVGTGGYYLYNQTIKGIQQEYETKLKDLQLQQYNSKRQVYVAKENISFGTQLNEDLFDLADITSSLDRSLYMTKEDIGKFAKSEIIAGIPVMKHMVSEEKIQHDIRREEFNMFLLQSNLKKDEFIDLRIMYPNGEDFIVLAKKKIRDINLSQNTIWCWLDEREILTVSSAIVDAYINKGTKLYVVTYVEPSSQKDAIPTYPANVDVMRLMASDPNIVDKAKLFLSEQVRVALDARLKAIPSDTSAKVQSEVSKEINGVQGTIQKDAITNNNSSGDNKQEQPKVEPTSVPSQNESEKEGDKSGFFN